MNEALSFAPQHEEAFKMKDVEKRFRSPPVKGFVALPGIDFITNSQGQIALTCMGMDGL